MNKIAKDSHSSFQHNQTRLQRVTLECSILQCEKVSSAYPCGQSIVISWCLYIIWKILLNYYYLTISYCNFQLVLVLFQAVALQNDRIKNKSCGSVHFRKNTHSLTKLMIHCIHFLLLKPVKEWNMAPWYSICSWCDRLSDWFPRVDPLGYLSFHPMLHNWPNYKRPLATNGKSSHVTVNKMCWVLLS